MVVIIFLKKHNNCQILFLKKDLLLLSKGPGITFSGDCYCTRWSIQNAFFLSIKYMTFQVGISICEFGFQITC